MKMKNISLSIIALCTVAVTQAKSTSSKASIHAVDSLSGVTYLKTDSSACAVKGDSINYFTDSVSSVKGAVSADTSLSRVINVDKDSINAADSALFIRSALNVSGRSDTSLSTVKNDSISAHTTFVKDSSDMHSHVANKDTAAAQSETALSR